MYFWLCRDSWAAMAAVVESKVVAELGTRCVCMTLSFRAGCDMVAEYMITICLT